MLATRSGRERKNPSRELELARELRRKEKQLAEAVALVELSRKARGLLLGGRGRLHSPEVRSQVYDLVAETVSRGARQSSACRLLGLSARTLQRWRKPGGVRDGRPEARRTPANRLEEYERGRLLEVLHSPAFQGLSPRQLVPRLADQDVYLASESTLYRLLRAQRVPGRARGIHRARPLHEQLASAPNQIWSWDITYLKGPERGRFLYLYLVMDVFSRRIMGWRLHTEESAERASALIRELCQDNAVDPKGLVLHADNGRPMRSATMLSTLRRLGIVPSFSRPGVSNDNTFVESLFHTLKGRPDYPSAGGFPSLPLARAWVTRFVDWYNSQHLHSRLGYVTPDDRYLGRDAGVLERRARLYERARAQRPERWSRPPRSWAPAQPTRAIVRTYVGLQRMPHCLPSKGPRHQATTGLTRLGVKKRSPPVPQAQ
jgi:transposase InsO family protein